MHARANHGPSACAWRFAQVCVFLGATLLGVAWARGAYGGVTVYSSTGQFVVHSPYSTIPTFNQWVHETNASLIVLQPDPLVVSCERVKRAFLRELDMPDRWQCRVHLYLRPDLMQPAVPRVVSTHYADGWQYIVDLPEHVEPRAALRVLVQALLTEYANRQTGPYSPELPIWLVEGLAAKLQGGLGPDLLSQTTPLMDRVGTQMGRLRGTSRDQIGTGDLDTLRRWLVGHTPLTFNTLSLPKPDDLTGVGLETYRNSARLFLEALQDLPGGRRALTSMLGLLPQRLNWQTAFLQAYRAYFPRLLEAEKWWAVVALQFVTGTQGHAWSRATSLAKLEEVLHVTVDIQARPNEAPRRTVRSLQQLIQESDYAQHRELVRGRLGLLRTLQPNAAVELLPWLRGYAEVLQRYLDQRSQMAAGAVNPKAIVGSPLWLVQDTVRRLDELDLERASFFGGPAHQLAPRPGS